MTKFEAPMQHGPLDNPNWTEEQNREFDRGQDRKTGEQARRDALDGRDDVDITEAANVVKRDLGGAAAPSTERSTTVEERAAIGLRRDQEIRYADKAQRRADEDTLRAESEPGPKAA